MRPIRALWGLLQLIFQEYRRYLDGDQKMDAESRRIRLRSVDEAEALIREMMEA